MDEQPRFGNVVRGAGRRCLRCAGWVAAVLVLCACGGCPKQEKGGEAAPLFAGQAIRALVPSGLGLPQSWKVLANEWSAQTGASVPISEYEAAGNVPLDKVLEAHAGGALWLFPISEAANLAAKGRLAPLSRAQLEDSGGLQWRSLFQGLRDHVASNGREGVVLPISCPVLVCYFRRDLFEKAGIKPPETWADYDALVATQENWAGGLPVLEPWGKEERATTFLARAVSYAKHPSNYSLYLDIESAEPLIGGPAFVRALGEVKAALMHLPKEVLTYTAADCRREMGAGRAAMVLAFETLEAADLGSRPEEMTIGCVRLPGSSEVYNLVTGEWEPAEGVNRVTLTAFRGWCAGVSANGSPQQTLAAWSLLETLAGERLADAFPKGTRSPVREEHLGAPEPWVGGDLTTAEGFEYLEAVGASLRDKRLVAELPLPGRERLRGALTEAVTDAIERGADPADALGKAASEWRGVIEEVGRAEMIDAYRRAVGLLPKMAR